MIRRMLIFVGLSFLMGFIAFHLTSSARRQTVEGGGWAYPTQAGSFTEAGIEDVVICFPLFLWNASLDVYMYSTGANGVSIDPYRLHLSPFNNGLCWGVLGFLWFTCIWLAGGYRAREQVFR